MKLLRESCIGSALMPRHTLGGLRPLLCLGVLEYGLGPRDTLAVAALTEEHPLRGALFRLTVRAAVWEK